jgi:hypothetical protein
MGKAHRARRPAWLALLACAAAGCTRATPPVPAPPAVASPAPAAGPTLSPAEPTAEDTSEFLEQLRVETRAWRYDGPAGLVRFTIEATDSGEPIVSSSSTMPIEPGARVVFALMPPSEPGTQGKAYVGVALRESRRAMTTTLPPLWFGWQGSFSTETSSSGAISMVSRGGEDGTGDPILHAIHAELFAPVEADATTGEETGKAQVRKPERTIDLRLRAAPVPPTTEPGSEGPPPGEAAPPASQPPADVPQEP